AIGGGGGIAGDLAGAPLVVGAAGADGGAAGGGGNGGVLTVVASADIVTAGDHAFGILAQSIGGGGGLSGDASAVSAGPTQSGRTGSGGLIHLAQSGRVYANGNGAVGIFAQSQGPTADGGMDLTIMGDVVGGTGDQGAGVWLVGGNQKWLAVEPGARVTAGSRVATRYDDTRSVYAGSETTVQNYGTIAGDILLHAPDSSSAGTINNLGAITPAAAARAGTPARGGVLVGARRYDASVVNHGTLIVGHNAMVDATAISGDFEQGRQGTLMVDADFERRAADRLHVQGDARLDGQLDIAALSLMPGRRVTVLTVDGDAAGQLAPRQSPIFDYALRR